MSFVLLRYRSLCFSSCIPCWLREKEVKNLEKEKRLQQAMLDIKKKYGKNAILKGMNLEEGATAIERNRQIGGHKA